jgi:outer membrane protein assembly factor BamB
MNDFIFFLKANVIDLVFASIAVGVSITLALLIRHKPEKLGLTKPVKKSQYLMSLLPLVVVGFVFYNNKTEGLSYPTGVDQQGNIIFVRGIVVFYRERPEDGLEIEEQKDLLLLLDKTTGKEVTRLNSTSGYINNNRLFTPAPLGYQILDLTEGKVVAVLTEGEIQDRIARFTSEKLYSLEFNPGNTYFDVRTVLDKRFTYDPLLDTINVQQGHGLNFSGGLSHRPYTGQTKLFQPEVIGEATNGYTFLLSYDDLEKDSFILTAVNTDGAIQWSKRDSEISSKLDGEPFYYSEYKNNTWVDGPYLYFINRTHLVCLQTNTGELSWIVSI